MRTLLNIPDPIDPLHRAQQQPGHRPKAISPGDGPHLPGDHSDAPERAEPEPDHGADVQLPAVGPRRR